MRKYVTNGTCNKSVPEEELESFLREHTGWRAGRCTLDWYKPNRSTAGCVFVNDGDQSKAITADELESFLRDHPKWRRGRLPSKTQGDTMREIWSDPIYRQKMSEAHTGYKFTDDQRKRLSDTMKRKCADPEYRAKMSLVSKQNWEDPEYRAKMMAWRDNPEKRECLSRALKTAFSDPTWRKNQSDRTRTQMADTRMKKIIAESNRTRDVTEDCRQKHREATLRLRDEERGPFDPTKRRYVSRPEQGVANYISSIYDGSVERNRFYPLHGKGEIDIYLPKLKLGIEFNGDYWHSHRKENANHHMNKFKLAKEYGIHLIQIWEHEWYNNNEKIKNFLYEQIHRYDHKYFARKLTLTKIPSARAKEFYNEYHLQGGRHSAVSYGLFDCGTLISVMSFSKLRIRHHRGDNEWDLVRYCTKAGCTVLGGAERLFKAFVREYDPESIVSFSDNDYFDGGIYPRLGFTYQGMCRVYSWGLPDGVFTREQCQLSALEKRYPGVLAEADEWKASNGNKGSREWYICDQLLGGLQFNKAGRTKWLWIKER